MSCDKIITKKYHKSFNDIYFSSLSIYRLKFLKATDAEAYTTVPTPCPYPRLFVGATCSICTALAFYSPSVGNVLNIMPT